MNINIYAEKRRGLTLSNSNYNLDNFESLKDRHNQYCNFRESSSNNFGDKNTNLENESLNDYHDDYVGLPNINSIYEYNLNIYSNDNFKSTDEPSNEISQKMDKNNLNNVSSMESSNDCDSNNIISRDFESRSNHTLNNLLANDLKEIKKFNNNDNTSVENSIIQNYENSNEKTALNKRGKNIFQVVYSNDFNIFHFIDYKTEYNSEYNKFYLKMIKEIINDNKKVNQKKINNSKETNKNLKKTHKKNKNILKRKQNSDNIRKKIKARFLKSLKNCIREKLKSAGSKKFFNFLPQVFTTNLSKKLNNEVLDSSFEQLFSTNFCKGKAYGKANLRKYYYNLNVLDYLANNTDISEKSNFYKIKSMKYSDIFKEYLLSKEFRVEIYNLKLEQENEKYIKNYIIKSLNLLNFFKTNN